MNYTKSIIFFFILLLSQGVMAQTLLSEEELAEQKVFKNLDKALKDPNKVYILDLSGQDLDKLPRDIGRFRRVQILKLTNNNLSELPREMTRLRNLQVLYLDSNNFTKLNFDFSNPIFYKNLEKLYLGHNPLKELPQNLKER